MLKNIKSQIGSIICLASAILFAPNAKASCSGNGFYPANNPVASITLNGYVSQQSIKLSGATLGLSPRPGSVLPTKQAITLGLQDNSDQDGIDFTIVQHGQIISLTQANVTAFYPLALKDQPIAVLILGPTLLHMPANRDPSNPSLADVYASFPLTSVPPAALGFNAPVRLRLYSKDGKPLVQADYTIPPEPAWVQMLNDAKQQLSQSCAAGGNGFAP